MFNRGSTSQSFDWHGAQRMCACLVVELPRNLHQMKRVSPTGVRKEQKSPANEAKLIVYLMIYRVYSMSYRVYPMIYRVYPMFYRMYSMIYRVYPMIYRVYPMIYRCYRVCPIIYRDYSMNYRVYPMICRIYSMIYRVLVVHSKLFSQDALNHQTVFVITSICLKHSEKRIIYPKFPIIFVFNPQPKKKQKYNIIYLDLPFWVQNGSMTGCQ